MEPRIISASRRTDIPAFFTPWWLQRVREGYVMVPNPRRPSQVAKVSLLPRDVLAVVYWSRDYAKLLPHVASLEAFGLPGIFHITITEYGPRFEPNAPPTDKTVRQAIDLCSLVGPRRVTWRYDPIILGSHHDPTWHIDRFERLARSLSGNITQCVISFVDSYASTKRGLAAVNENTGELFAPPSRQQRLDLASDLVRIGRHYGISVTACCEPDLHEAIPQGRCIDPHVVELAARRSANHLKAAPTRKGCGCVYAKDVGVYDTCPRGCVYCYANASPRRTAVRAARVNMSANTLGPTDLDESAPKSRAKG